MSKQRRDRKRRSIYQRNVHGAMAVADLQVSTAEAFVRKAYSVDEYIRAKGIDTRRGIAGG